MIRKKVYLILITILIAIAFLVHLQPHQIILQLISPKHYEPLTNHSITIVSAFFDISRMDRSKEIYFDWIRKTIKINAPFVFFTQAKYKNEIEKIFETKQNNAFKIIAIELEDLEY